MLHLYERRRPATRVVARLFHEDELAERRRPIPVLLTRVEDNPSSSVLHELHHRAHAVLGVSHAVAEAKRGHRLPRVRDLPTRPVLVASEAAAAVGGVELEAAFRAPLLLLFLLVAGARFPAASPTNQAEKVTERASDGPIA